MSIKYVIVNKGVKKICTRYEPDCLCSFFKTNVDSSFNIKDRLLKFSVVVLGIMIEGTYTMESIKCFQIFVIK